MAAFDEKHIQAAIARLPSMGTKDIRDLQARAEAQNLSVLREACEAELVVRPVDFSNADAIAHAQMANFTDGLGFIDTVATAFSKVRPPSEVEQAFLTWIADHPGASYDEAVTQRGKGDVSLLIGHLIYDRFGCFRRFVTQTADLSSLLLIKDRTGPSVRYTLREDAREGLVRAGVL